MRASSIVLILSIVVTIVSAILIAVGSSMANNEALVEGADVCMNQGCSLKNKNDLCYIPGPERPGTTTCYKGFCSPDSSKPDGLTCVKGTPTDLDLVMAGIIGVSVGVVSTIVSGIITVAGARKK